MLPYDQNFDELRFREAFSMFVGERCIRNLVKVNLREPDPFGYIRRIHSINVTESYDEQSLIYGGNRALHKTLYIEIKAKSFMWGQIRIMVETCLKYARGELTTKDLNALLTAEEYLRLESGK